MHHDVTVPDRDCIETGAQEEGRGALRNEAVIDRVHY